MSPAAPDISDPTALVHGPAARAALEVAAGQLGGVLVGHRTRSVEHRGRGATAAYDITVEASGAAAETHLVALTTDVESVRGTPGTLVVTGVTAQPELADLRPR